MNHQEGTCFSGRWVQSKKREITPGSSKQGSGEEIEGLRERFPELRLRWIKEACAGQELQVGIRGAGSGGKGSPKERMTRIFSCSRTKE